jgi:hypothetical protein
MNEVATPASPARPATTTAPKTLTPAPAAAPAIAPVVTTVAPASSPAVEEKKPAVEEKQVAARPVDKPAAIKKPKAVEPPPITVADILGAGPAKVTGILGEPGLVRRESPAEVWQYAGTGCVLHVFLYDDEPSGTFRVDHLEATDLQGARASTNHCLTGLALSR